MEADIYYAIFNDLSYEEYIDMQSAINANPYIIIRRRYRDKIQSHFNEDYFKHYDWDMFNEKGCVVKITERKWLLYSIFDDLQRGHYFQFKISDPKGKIVEYTIKAYGIGGVIEGIDYLRLVNKYENWDYYYLSKENEMLKSENKELIEKIEKLKEENDIK